jgi:hypothetical protein
VNRALVSFAAGDFEPLLEIARPRFAQYADRHRYELITKPPALLLRPASWHKISVLLDVLEDYDEALWVDCDVVIVDASADLAGEVPAEAWQAITRHATAEGEVPSAGVWYLRQSMQPVLEAIWRLERYRHHRWWEQAALQKLLGYTPDRLPVRLERETDLYRRTHWLDNHWNALAFPGAEPDPRTRIAHAAPGSPVDVRARLMQDLIERSETRAQVPTA